MKLFQNYIKLKDNEINIYLQDKKVEIILNYLMNYK